MKKLLSLTAMASYACKMLAISFCFITNIYTAQAQALYIDPNNKVGINVENPANTLDIKDNTPRSGAHSGGLGLYITNPNNVMAEFRTPDAKQGIGISKNGIYTAGTEQHDLNVKSTFRINLSTDNTNRLVIGQNGNVDIGNAQDVSLVNKLQLGGNLHMNGNAIYFKNNLGDKADLIKWISEASNRMGMAGWDGVVLGYTNGQAVGNIKPVLTISANDHIDLNGPLYGDYIQANNMYIKGKNGAINQPMRAAYIDVGETPMSDAGTLATVFARLGEGNNINAGTYFGVKAYSTQPQWAKSFSIEHSYYGTVNNSINFYRGGGAEDGYMTFCTRKNNERIRITAEGRVGIGETNPQVPLHVGTSASYRHSGGDYSYVNKYVLRNTTMGHRNISILSAADIASGYEFIVYSDARIKKDKRISNATTDLDILKKVEVTEYRYIDEVNYGDKYKKGFIAQQVESVYSEAVKRGTDFIPSIFSVPEKMVAQNGKLVFSMPKPHELKTGDKVKIITPFAERQTIITVLTDNTFSIEGVVEDYKDAFVFGKQVNDFRMVDYDRLFTLNISATQELSRKVEKLEAENEKMRNTYSDLLEKITALEARMNTATTTLTVSK